MKSEIPPVAFRQGKARSIFFLIKQLFVPLYVYDHPPTLDKEEIFFL